MGRIFTFDFLMQSVRLSNFENESCAEIARLKPKLAFAILAMGISDRIHYLFGVEMTASVVLHSVWNLTVDLRV